MYVEEIMTTEVVSVAMDDTLEKVKEIFDSASFHHLLVLREGKLVGVISDRDLLKNLSPSIGTGLESRRDLAALSKRAHQIMSRELVTLARSATVADAVALFLGHRISCIPVVDADNRPVGIISWRDILLIMHSP